MIKNFKKYKWGDLCSLEYGKSLRTYQDKEDKYPVYGSSGVIGFHNKPLSNEPGVIVSRKGTLGVHYSEKPFYVIDTAFWLKPKNKIKIDLLWAYYSILNFQVKNLKTGTGVPSLSRDDFYDLDVYLPEYEYQKKIAEFLFKFDQNININQKKNNLIRNILDLTFNKIFYNFENLNINSMKTKFNDFLKKNFPDDWSMQKFGDILSDLESGDRPKGGINKKEIAIPSIGAENIIKVGSYNYLNEKYVTENFFKSLKKGIVKSNDVLMYKDGASLGRVSYFKNGFPHDKCCINSHVFILRTNHLLNQEFLYMWLEQDFMKKIIFKIGVKAAQPGINQEDVNDLPVLIPTKSYLDLFEKKTKNLFDKIFNNSLQNKFLSKYRNWLLPLIINGQIKLS